MPEYAVARADDLQNGEMKQVAAGDTDVLLARVDGQYHAVYAYCTHYGAPLADGALSGDRVVCPWHHACFHLPTGDHLEPPGLDGLPRFQVRIEGDAVLVDVPDDAPNRRVASMADRDEQDERVAAVLGAGAAGAYAAEALRANGFTGRVVLISREDEVPYDRPNLSKDYLQGEAEEAWMPLRDADFYQTHAIELRLGQAATRVDVRAKTLQFEDGSTLAYDGLVLCTGGTPRRLDVPGADLEGVYTLRSFQDSRELHEAAEAAGQAVVVGASFIGMEAAFSLRELGLDVTVVAPGETPFASVLGDRVGQRVQAIHEEHGVRFRLGRKVQRLDGDERVAGVTLDDGTSLDADLVVVGIGVTPATDFVEGVERGDEGGLEVDAHLRAAGGLYVAGDIAHFPHPQTGDGVRIEHWRLACQHGRLAGANLAAELAAEQPSAGKRQPYRSVPFFWTAHFGTNLRYVGHAEDPDEILYDGDPEDGAFIAYYVRDGQVRAAAGVGRDREMAALEEAMRRELLPAPETLAAGSVDLLRLVAS